MLTKPLYSLLDVVPDSPRGNGKCTTGGEKIRRIFRRRRGKEGEELKWEEEGDVKEKGTKRARTKVESSSHRRSLSVNSRNNRELSMSSGWEGASNNSSVSTRKRCSEGRSGEGGEGGVRGARGPASAAPFRVGQRVWAWHVCGSWDWATIVEEPNEKGQFTIEWADCSGSDTKKAPKKLALRYTNLFT